MLPVSVWYVAVGLACIILSCIPRVYWISVLLFGKHFCVIPVVLGIENRIALITNINAAFVCVPGNSYRQGHLQLQKTLMLMVLASTL